MLRVIKKIRRYFQRRYLFETIQALEEFSTERKLWRVGYMITMLHCELLIKNKDVLTEREFIKRLSTTRFSSKFNNLSEVEEYAIDFINQTIPFVKGEIKSRPKINNGKLEKDPVRKMGLLYFLEAKNEVELFDSIVRIRNICFDVDAHCSSVSIARQQILESICKDIFSPLLTVLQEIFEVLYANQTRKSS